VGCFPNNERILEENEILKVLKEKYNFTYEEFSQAADKINRLKKSFVVLTKYIKNDQEYAEYYNIINTYYNLKLEYELLVKEINNIVEIKDNFYLEKEDK
jgi:hypothetical protein